MSVMNMNSRMAMAEKLSVAQLQQAVQSGSLPAYIGVPLIEQKMKAQKQAAVPQQQAQRPIAQEVMEEASGIASVPSNLPVSGYADGGIVAFAEGGDVDDFDYEEYLEQKEESDYEDMIRKYMAQAEAAGIEGIPINRTKKVEQKYAQGGIVGYNNGGMTALQRQILAYRTDQGYRDFANSGEADVSLERFYGTGEGQLGNPLPRSLRTTEMVGNPDDDNTVETSPAGDFVRNLYGKTKDFSGTVLDKVKPVLKDRFSADYQNRANEVRRLGVEGGPFAVGRTDFERERAEKQSAEGIKNLAQPRTNLLTSVVNPQPSAPPAMLPTVSVTPDTASVPTPANAPMDMYPEEQGGLAFLGSQAPIERAAPTDAQAKPQGGSPQAGTPRGSAPSGESPRSERPKSAFDDFMADIKASREDLKKQQSQDKYMALLSAGLGMMSGTSPNAFANIGQGAQAGVASYGASQKQRAAERAALNKNLLMGQRYQSMEDIANRTADISEMRYRDAAAARGAGGDSKTEAELNRQENAFTNRLRNAELSVKAGLEARFGDPKLAAMINKEEYAAAVRELNKRYVDPVIILQNQFLSKRYPSVYGDPAPAPTAPQAAPAASSGFKIIK